MYQETKIQELASSLKSLDSTISNVDAQKLSKDIFMQTRRLTQLFKMESPAWYHNFLVNIGLKEKGLCYHWSDTLYAYFSKKKYSSFEFHLMVAHKGEYWREHNALLVTAKNKKIEEGIVLDPWRNAGALYFSKLLDDTQYPWVHRANRGCQ